MEATSLMSDYIEIINPQSMTANCIQNGEVIAEYKVAQCDGCAQSLTRLDAFGYKRDRAAKNLLGCAGVAGENDIDA
jgi:hypothetical protein